MLRRFCIVLALLVFCACGISAAYAGSTDSLTVKVTVTPSISVSITETELQLGSVAAGGVLPSTTGVTVTNNGSGVNETYSLSLVNPSGWTAIQRVDDSERIEEYVLNAALDADGTSITWDNANHALSTTPVPCSATKFAADQTGVDVPYSATRKLWFQFKAPTATIVGSEQGIPVTVTAGLGS